MIQPGLCLLHGIRLNPKSQKLRFGQAVIASCQLLSEHLAVLGANRIKFIFPKGNPDRLLKAFCIRRHIHKGKLEVDGAVEKVQKSTPLFKNRRFILLLGQLVVDILKLDCLCVVVVPYPADSVREHPLKRDGLLCGTGDAVIPTRRFHNGLYLLLLLWSQMGRHFHIAFHFLFSKQSAVPPSQPDTAAEERNSSYLSHRAVFSA